MSIQECCEKIVVCGVNLPVSQAISLIANHDIEEFIVVETINNLSVPVGIITNHDMAIRASADASITDSLKVADLMSSPLITIESDATPAYALNLMRRHGVRRVPVTDKLTNRMIGVARLNKIYNYLACAVPEIKSLAKIPQSALYF